MDRIIKYTTLKEWRSANPKAYQAALNKKLLAKICGITGWTFRQHVVYPKTEYWGSYIACKNKARYYETVEDWKNGHQKSYDCAKRRKYLGKIKREIGWYVQQGLTKDECIKRSSQYVSKLEWLKGDMASCKAAYRNNWVEGVNINQWSSLRCKKDALKYDKLNDWKIKSTDAYIISLVKGWYRDSTTHISNSVEKYWGKNTCIKEAQKYKNVSEWKKKHMISYRVATRKYWLEQCTKHMK